MLNRLPPCFLCTEDPAIERMVQAYVKYLADVRTVHDANEVLLTLAQFDPALLILDLRTRVARDHLVAIFEDHPDALVLAIGAPRTVPAQQAEAMGAYALVEPTVDRHRLQTLVRHALDHLRLLEQNRLLKLQAAKAAAKPDAGTAAVIWPPPPTAAELFSQSLRFFDNPDMMFETMAHGLIAGAKVTRVVIFSYRDDDDTFHYLAGVNGLRHTLETRVPQDAPFIRHLRLNAHVISRASLDALPAPEAAGFLKQALDTMGAELIIPMQANHSLIGWVAIGHRITGMPFSQQDIEHLAPLVDQVAVALSNQLLLSRISIQKALAESVFHAMPVGVVAVGPTGHIHWINQTGAAIFGVEPGEVIRRPVSQLASQLADGLTRCMQEPDAPEILEWDHPPGGNPLQVNLRRMRDGNTCIGALAVLRDISRERRVRQKEAELERQSFWTGLAAAMSHEIRNPLVAISTFAQLLPERYTDPEFRDRFSTLVAQEISRLNGIVNQISDFAEHRQPDLKPVIIQEVLTSALALVRTEFPERGDIIEMTDNASPILIHGDVLALRQAFVYLLRNAIEATASIETPCIRVGITLLAGQDQANVLCVTIKDNGPGIPEAQRQEAFSPFYTTKPRGIGVGLAVARRTVIDHGGTIAIGGGAAGETGAQIEVRIPNATPAPADFVNPDPADGIGNMNRDNA